MVFTSRPATPLTGVEHARTGSPSTSTVHAPHSAMPQPNLVPIKPNVSRRTHNNGVLGSTSAVKGVPFKRRLMLAMPPPLSLPTCALTPVRRVSSIDCLRLEVALSRMNALLAFLVGGAVVALIALVLWRRSRGKPAAVDPIISTTGSNRTLTARQSGPASAMSYNEALRRFAAFALDDAPRESLSLPPNPDHAPVFQSVQQVLERIEARPEYIPR